VNTHYIAVSYIAKNYILWITFLSLTVWFHLQPLLLAPKLPNLVE